MWPLLPPRDLPAYPTPTRKLVWFLGCLRLDHHLPICAARTSVLSLACTRASALSMQVYHLAFFSFFFFFPFVLSLFLTFFSIFSPSPGGAGCRAGLPTGNLGTTLPASLLSPLFFSPTGIPPSPSDHPPEIRKGRGWSAGDLPSSWTSGSAFQFHYWIKQRSGDNAGTWYCLNHGMRETVRMTGKV